jgi:hypothetical protein
MAICNGVKEVAWLDCAGGGQVVVEGNYGYIGHMAPPHGTSVVDLSDPKNPRKIAEIEIPKGLHSHKVRVGNGLMLVNHEILLESRAGAEGLRGGLGIYDVSNPAKPREINRWQCDGSGVHRFTFDGRYAYISPEVAGYLGNIVMILDLADPMHPQEVGRWWMPGQWTAGGEISTWEASEHRCHHPIRRGDRLYVSYWHGGFVILDISDMTKPKRISGLDWSPPFAWPTHSAVPVPFPINGRNYMLVADEDVARLDPDPAPELSAFLWLLDITDETNPVPFSTFQVAGVHGKRNPPMTGCHQPVETIRGTEIPVAWFAQGLRFIDIANPQILREAASYIPEPPGGGRVSSNDVFADDRGLVYLIDRMRGLSIVERV